MQHLVFRPAVAADVPAVVQLVESAYRGEPSRAGWTTEADFLEGQRTDAAAVAALLTAPKSALITAWARGELVACCHVAVADGAGYFGMFAVVPGLQGGGLGRAVLAEAERLVALDWGMGEMRMKVVDRRTELIDWYLRRGYARLPGTTPFPYGDESFGRPLVEGLAFVTLAKALDVR